MNIACPQCSSVYRVDPARVPASGILADCRECGARLRVEPGEERPGDLRTASLAPAEPATPSSQQAASGTEPATEPTGAGAERDALGVPGLDTPAGGEGRRAAPVFGPQDPETRAMRLARALVSDIVVYNPDKWRESRDAGTLRKEFRDEILKSWEEYVEQVGDEMAKKTPYFRDALNAILAEGNRVF